MEKKEEKEAAAEEERRTLRWCERRKRLRMARWVTSLMTGLNMDLPALFLFAPLAWTVAGASKSRGGAHGEVWLLLCLFVHVPLLLVGNRLIELCSGREAHLV